MSNLADRSRQGKWAGPENLAGPNPQPDPIAKRPQPPTDRQDRATRLAVSQDRGAALAELRAALAGAAPQFDARKREGDSR